MSYVKMWDDLAFRVGSCRMAVAFSRIIRLASAFSYPAKICAASIDPVSRDLYERLSVSGTVCDVVMASAFCRREPAIDDVS
jgi:hypothetical protein